MHLWSVIKLAVRSTFVKAKHGPRGLDPIAKGRQNKGIKIKETRLFNPGRGNRSYKKQADRNRWTEIGSEDAKIQSQKSTYQQDPFNEESHI